MLYSFIMEVCFKIIFILPDKKLCQNTFPVVTRTLSSTKPSVHFMAIATMYVCMVKIWGEAMYYIQYYNILAIGLWTSLILYLHSAGGVIQGSTGSDTSLTVYIQP